MSAFVQYHAPRRQTRAVRALLLHECRSGEQDACEYLFTSHRIESTDTGPVIAEGRLLDETDHRTFLTALLGARAGRETEYLPPELLCFSASQLAWYVPAHVAPMWFRTGTRCVRYQVPWPTLIFRVRQGELALAAIRGRRRPRSCTPVFHAPLMNVFPSTGLCAGSAAMPTTGTLADRKAYEAAVFETNFAHVNHHRTLTVPDEKDVSDATHVRFWRALHEQSAKHFPVRALVPLKCTLAVWLAARSA